VKRHPTRVFVFLWFLAAAPLLCETTEGSEPEFTSEEVWAAEKPQCPIKDLSKPWELENPPLLDDPRFLPAEIEIAPRPEFADSTTVVFFRPKPVFNIVVDPAGQPDRIGLIRGTMDTNLKEQIEVITRWRFQPATFNGRTICSIVIVSTPAVYE
jgi:hypothetical protein